MICFGPKYAGFSDDDALQCPRCGGGCLHHGEAELFYRASEDGESAVTLVTKQGVSRPTGEKNPSSRRDGLLISFYCEDCHRDDDSFEWVGDPFKLAITQHKGATYMAWKIPDG